MLGKLTRLVIIVLLLLLSGCNLINETPKNDTNVDETIKISKANELIVKEIATEYIINAKSLTTYINNVDPFVSYVNISDFITFMDGGIVDLSISKGDVMSISYTFDVPNEYQDIYGQSTYTYEMTIDALNDVISYNDFDMIFNMNVPTISQYETELFISNIEVISDDPSIDINLALYNFDIVLYEDNYYIPLYLANLFFTGATINVYEMNDYLYIIDNFTDLSELIDDFEIDKSINASDIISHTKNYLALYFDYFYGLKDFKNIDTYKEILDNFNFEEKDDFSFLHRELEKFIISQNDLHTSLVSAGYLNKNYIPSKIKSDKLSKYVTAYNNNSCYYREKEVAYRNYGTTFVVEVNAFSLDTRTLLKSAMIEAKNYDDVVIDVSCNSGGNLIGVVELLSYMTDDMIPISYINPATDEKITEYYDTTNNVYLNKNFFVYTSAASFSATNLFTSIVKDQELAIIFGENTSGGASAITYTVLPSGALIVNSSNFTLINKNGEIIEDGIEVDINYKFPFNWYDLIDYLNNLFSSSSEISVEKNIGTDSISYDFSVNSYLDILNITDYTLSVYDYKTSELLSSMQFTSDNFTFNMDKVEGNIAQKIEVSVKYNQNGVSKEEIIYTDIIDDHYNMFNLYVSEIPIEEKFEAYSHITNDRDTFKFNVLESGLYRIEINEDKMLYHHSLYDETGNLVQEGFDFHLEPGFYYLVAAPQNIGDYSIKIRKLEDDNTGPTIINLQDGIHQHKLYYDYIFDDESFEINVPEDSLVTFSWSKHFNYEYSIKNSNDELFSPKSDRLFTNDDITIIMPKGTYIVKLNDHFALGELNLTTSLTTDFIDYSGDTSLESENYGELIIGKNTIDFISIFDEDVYYIDITEEGSCYFEYDNNQGYVKYINSDGSLKYLYSNNILSLSKGRHYFVFGSYKSLHNSVIDFNLFLDIDLNNENNMEAISINQEKSTVISNSNDIDYFEFYSSELKTYKLNVSGSYCCTFYIIDLDGNQIARNRYDSFYFTVSEGTYILKVESHIVNQNTREITEYLGEDDAVNLPNLSEDNYQLIQIGFPNWLEGRINYENDQDVYIIKIEESGYYKSYLYGDYMIMNCVDEIGNSKYWNHGFSMFLEAGIYYLVLSSCYEYDDYIVAYSKIE